MKNVTFKDVDNVIERFYEFLPFGSTFSDATSELLKDNYHGRIEIKSMLLAEKVLENWGDHGKVILSPSGKEVWE
ncbi:MAG: hypothetical protein JW731_14365, partial [Bacteroidales bacterium]|nr:hypothetical protein [Bacteroidales bacterium]